MSVLASAPFVSLFLLSTIAMEFAVMASFRVRMRACAQGNKITATLWYGGGGGGGGGGRAY